MRTGLIAGTTPSEAYCRAFRQLRTRHDPSLTAPVAVELALAEFPAKVDLWFLAVFYGTGAAMLLTVPWVLKRADGWSAKRGRLGASIQAILGILFIGVGVQTSSVTYVLTEDGFLDARGGWPLSGRMMSIQDINQVRPSRDSRASHAASLDRLRIDYATRGVVFIAVHDKPAFLDALAARDPALTRTDTGVERDER